MPDPVNNETGSLGNGRTPAQTPYDSPAAGGSAQSTTYHQSGQPGAPAVANGGMASPNTPLHTDGGNIQHTGAGPGVDAGDARMPGVYASGSPVWTETLEAINAIPERIVNALREAELTRLGSPSSDPLPGAEVGQNTDAPNLAKTATGPSATPGEGDKNYHFWFRPFGSR